MTTKFDHTIWQDVHHAMTPFGEMAYIKVTGSIAFSGVSRDWSTGDLFSFGFRFLQYQ